MARPYIILYRYVRETTSQTIYLRRLVVCAQDRRALVLLYYYVHTRMCVCIRCIYTSYTYQSIYGACVYIILLCAAAAAAAVNIWAPQRTTER